MTYSQQVKAEICSIKPMCSGCRKAIIYGMLLTSRGVTDNTIEINTESKLVVDFFTDNIIDITGVIVSVKSPDLRDRAKRPTYTVFIENQEDINKIQKTFFAKIPIEKNSINYDLLQYDCCVVSFLRGAYLMCGSTINPRKAYHLELNISDENLCDEIGSLLEECDMNFKKTTRNKGFVLYIKESQQIEDMLTFLGAFKASMELMNNKIEKEIRNKANRQTNCETANIGKTVNASFNQVCKIKIIEQKAGLNSLTPELKEIAILRLENPDLSLSELCEFADLKISRSGLNHRLKKLCSIADELDK